MGLRAGLGPGRHTEAGPAPGRPVKRHKTFAMEMPIESDNSRDLSISLGYQGRLSGRLRLFRVFRERLPGPGACIIKL